MCVSLQKKLYIYTFVYKFKPIYIYTNVFSFSKKKGHPFAQQKTKKNIIYCAGKLRIRTPFASYALQRPSGFLRTHMYRYIYIHISIYIYINICPIFHKEHLYVHIKLNIYIYTVYIYIRIFAFLLLQPKNLCTFGVLAIPKNTTHWMNGLHWRLVNLPSFLVFGTLRGTLDVLIYRQRWLKHFDHLGRTAEGAGYMPYIP